MHDTRKKGNMGEDVACVFLARRGFSVIARNYLKKWGEIDIVAEKGGELHFFEVKSVMRTSSHSPEENVDLKKTRRLRRIISTYLSSRDHRIDHLFQFHVLCVFLNEKTRRARVRWLENVIL